MKLERRKYVVSITIFENIKYWHGEKKDSWFSHISIEVPEEDILNEWCKTVDEEYEKLGE